MISWKIAVGDLSGELEYIAPDQMSKARISIDGSGVWIGHPKYGTNFCVRTLFAPDRDGRQKGKIIISGFNGKKFLEEVRFPVIRCPYSEKTKLLDGAMDLGLIIRDPWLLEDCKENEFKCCSIPLFALLYPDGKGMYLDFRSEDHSPKKVLFNPDRKKGTAELSMSFFIGNGKTPAMGWEMPGECVFGEFAGSWYEAAQIYKEYAVTRSEFTARRGTNPLRQIGLWVWNRGNIADVIPPLKALQDELPGIPLALDWYWWHHNPYDTK